MKRLIDKAIAKKKTNRLAKEQELWAKVWLEAIESNSPNAPYFLRNYRSCGEKIVALMTEYGLQPGFKFTWFDKIICGLFYC
ncbi:MAG: hypothetical protein IJF84_00540 [Thermoguttaceae bacterium]|nr:hypothetical protein [Thermoguttaceae bacterium]